MSVLDPFDDYWKLLATLDLIAKEQKRIFKAALAPIVPVGSCEFRRRSRTNIRSGLRSRDRKRNGAEVK